MILADTNVLVYAHREDSTSHDAYDRWLRQVLMGAEPFGVSDFILSAFLRIVTHPRIFRTPTPISVALEFAESVRSAPNSVAVSPGERHWSIFSRLCTTAGAKGGLIPDAYLAALAIESGCELITADRDFARFEGLSWRHPIEGKPPRP